MLLSKLESKPHLKSEKMEIALLFWNLYSFVGLIRTHSSEQRRNLKAAKKETESKVVLKQLAQPARS